MRVRLLTFLEFTPGLHLEALDGGPDAFPGKVLLDTEGKDGSRPGP